MFKRKKLNVAVVAISVIAVFCILYISLYKSPFEAYYSNKVQYLNRDEIKTKVRSEFERDYTYTELLEWVNDTLTLDKTYNDLQRTGIKDPLKIIENERGQCEEFAILYVAACLAHGYDSRLVVATNVTDPNNWTDLHVWAEVKMCGWIHVDPAGVAWNDRYRYERCETGDWGKDIGSTVKIYAFEDGSCEEVTLSYLRNH